MVVSFLSSHLNLSVSLAKEKITPSPFFLFPFFSYSIQQTLKPVQYISHPHTSNCNSETVLPH